MHAIRLLLATAAGIFIGKSLFGERDAANENDFEKNFTGAYPRNSGAKSAVTGGDPEDMNGMPAAFDPQAEGPIYDGSQVNGKRSASDRRSKRLAS